MSRRARQRRLVQRSASGRGGWLRRPARRPCCVRCVVVEMPPRPAQKRRSRGRAGNDQRGKTKERSQFPNGENPQESNPARILRLKTWETGNGESVSQKAQKAFRG